MNILIKMVLLVAISCLYIQESIANMEQAPLSDNLNVLVFDGDLNAPLPKQFRTTYQDPKLGSLRISGSGQFTENNILAAAKAMQGKIWIIDLRRESHGFINGKPVSWYFTENKSNVGLSTHQIMDKEAGMLQRLKKYNPIPVKIIEKKSRGKIIETSTVDIIPELIETEEALSKRLGFNYLRFPVSDHHRPEDSIVDAFVEFIKTDPKDAWFHFHCRGGKGRTTTFMTMYDMLMNAKMLSANEIIIRQRQLGGSNLIKVSDNTEDQWKRNAQIARKAFIESFYEYAASKDGYPNLTWTEWLRSRNQ